MAIDNRDVSGVHCEYYAKMKKIFKENNVKYITRNLPLGDVIWLCRRVVYGKQSSKKTNKKKVVIEKEKEKENHNKNAQETIENSDSVKNKCENNLHENVNNMDNQEDVEYEEYVLKWIIERKTLNDLSASIIDGRYDEQKYRLMRAKDVNHIIYLIENSNNSFKNYTSSSKIPYETLENTQKSIQLVSGFSIINSQSMKHTLFLLSEMHFKILKYIKKECNITEPDGCLLNEDKLVEYLKTNASSWEIWNNESKKSKNSLVKEVFGKQLRLINMCGADATELILSLWPTPVKLNRALNKYTHDGILAEKLKRIYIKNYELQEKKKIKSPVNAQLIANLREFYAPDTI